MFSARETERNQRTTNARRIKKLQNLVCVKGKEDGMKQNKAKYVWDMKNDRKLELGFVILLVQFN